MADWKIVIRVSTQTAEIYLDNTLRRTYRISTAARGLGCEPGSNCTPLGLMRVAQKIGDGCAPGTVFRSRVATGEMWRGETTNEDLVLTRVLWLEGLEPLNANTRERYIYLHGTNQEHLLGQPVSHGCIRMANEDVIELFDWVPEGTLVEVLEA